MKKFLLLCLVSTALVACSPYQDAMSSDASQNTHQQTSGTSSLSGSVINVADRGIVPGEDVTIKVNELLASLEGAENVTLNFPKGQYDFYPKYAVEKYRYVANHDNGLKRMGFPIYNTKNITIDGNGSLFMFHGRVVPVTVESTDGVTLKDFSIDFIRPFHAELKIVKSNPEQKSFVAEIDAAMSPYEVKGGKILFDRLGQMDPIGSNIVIDSKTRAPIFNTRDYVLNGKSVKVTDLGNGRVRFDKINKTAPPVGSVLVVYGVHPTSRLVPGIHVTNSKDVKIENVTVHTAGGMGLIVERTENIHLDGYKLTSAEGRTVATRADATHFIGCKGEILVENSTMEHMLDDAINVHGAYVNIDEYLGDNKFLASISHFQQMGFVFGEAGDKVAILSRETVLPFHETEIKSFTPINEKRFLLTLDSVPEDLPEGPLSLENLTWNPSLTFRNNTVRENRARSMLVTTKGKVLVENNYFSSQMHGILLEGDNKFWYESGAVEDVTIQGNTFVNSGFLGGAAYPLLASPLFTQQQRIGEGHYHHNVKFNNNTLRGFNGLLVKSLSVEGLEIIGNKLEFLDDYPPVSSFPAIDINYSKDVIVKDNVATGFDWPLKVTVSGDSENVVVENNSGFTASE
ncbi:alpha-1,3-galactosidase-related protein [Robiginitomaculum antarcticum]|uniref:alpha-1,3-galactosidase-related protein n=1 Tax=Robiginitomaculum antarcticum TaxID=437507 RepID=UPI00039D8D28|nr:right-handed parallel beta-helix repeat-containing protein [Robiginitomaculum antarcticum]